VFCKLANGYLLTANCQLLTRLPMSPKKLHMIGNAHIDPVWLWRWQEGFHEVKASFRSALDRLNEYPDFTFVSSSAAFYEWVEQSDPAMFEEIRQRVAEGRWEIVGGWWIQPDCNIPGGESFVRQALYGQRYFQEKFGVMARVGYNVDSFGHAGSLPQILKKSGCDYYVFMRPSPHEKGLPGRLFWWEADDGSRVLTFRIPFEYCTWGKELDKHIRRCAAEIKPPVDELMCFYGVGNHGGGPTQENIESIICLNQEPELPELIFSTPNRFFDAVVAQDLPLPTVHEDLQHHASGCYAAHSGIKRWNRQAENLLMTAEKWSAVALRATGQPYAADFARAWKGVLFNQFHDILAGTSLPSAYDDARDLHGEAMNIGARALNLATQSIAWNIQIPQEESMTPLVVFNPHTWAGKQVVELEYGRYGANGRLVDDEGNTVPLQQIQSETTTRGRTRLCFLADLPGLGYRTYRLFPGEAAATGSIEATDSVLDNGRFRLEFDPESGAIASLRDKTHEVEVFLGQAALPVVLEDTSDTWSHNVFRFDKAIGQFKAVRVQRVEHGPVKSTIRVTSEYGRSQLVQEFSMYRELDRIDVQVTVDWREHFKALKLRFPLNQNFMRVVHEIAYGHIERTASDEEEPCQRWVDVSGADRDQGISYGLSLLNDGKYSVDVHIRDIGLTVLRSPIYAHHIPAQPEPDGHYQFIDQGIQRFTYSLLPHAGSWEDAATPRHAAAINELPVALVGTYHPEGTLPQSASYLSVEPANIVATVLKKAEEGDDLILRCYETNRVATHATLHLPQWNRTIQADFGPCEIKTFRIPVDGGAAAVETSLLE
jgi:alpha-mannosidase